MAIDACRTKHKASLSGLGTPAHTTSGEAFRMFVWLRCASQGHEHAVPYGNLQTYGLINGCRAVCGHFVVVVPATIVGRSGRRCRRARPTCRLTSQSGGTPASSPLPRTC